MKKLKRSMVLPAALFIYTTAMAVYFLPRNGELSNTEKWVTILLSYPIFDTSFVKNEPTDRCSGDFGARDGVNFVAIFSLFVGL